MQEYKISESDLIVFSGLLPFKTLRKPTSSLQRPHSRSFQRTFDANRLIQGDVGSGKTVVALFAAYASFNNVFKQ